MKKLLLPILCLLIYTCDSDNPAAPIHGCLDSQACNYNEDATIDNNSCTYADEGYDCEGSCTLAIDCSGECGGSAIEDCSGECGGNTVVDECGICGGDDFNEDGYYCKDLSVIENWFNCEGDECFNLFSELNNNIDPYYDGNWFEWKWTEILPNKYRLSELSILTEYVAGNCGNSQNFDYSCSELGGICNSCSHECNYDCEPDCHNGSIEFIPDNIGDLTSLTYLNLNSKEIQELPSSLFNLTNLETFYCEACNIQGDAFNQICNLVNLSNFNCLSCDLTSLPSCFCDLPANDSFYQYYGACPGTPCSNFPTCINYPYGCSE